MSDPTHTSEFNPFAPHTWPKWARRVFVIGFPVTVPLWLASSAILAVAIIVAFPLVMIWKGEWE